MRESLPANKTISHYRILHRLGAGGMGEVYLAWAYATANRKDEAIKSLNELKGTARSGSFQSVSIALIYTALGDKEQAFVWLEKGYQEHTEAFLDNINSPDFESLRSDPRFQKTLRSIGFPP